MALQPALASSTTSERHKRVWLLYTMVTQSTVKLAELTGYSESSLRSIIRQQLIENATNAQLEEERMSLWADLEEAKRALQAGMFPDGVGIVMPDKDDVASLVKLVHEQALLIGAHMPKQIRVNNETPDSNPEAEEYARGVVRFMELADKIHSSGYGSGRAHDVIDVDAAVEGDDVVPATTPELLRQLEAEGNVID